MSTINIDLIRRKLSRLTMYLERLKPLLEKKIGDYLKDDYLRFSTERLIQLIVECAADINNHVVVKNGQKPPEDYRSSFVKAAEAGLISRGLADNIKGSAGMRNILVHEYMDIDDKLIFETIPLAIKHYREYCKEVNAFIEKLEKKK